MTKKYFEPPLPRVFAHRGLAAGSESRSKVPENTLLAFEQAVNIGVLFVETDVHASSDGIAIVSHDPDLVRLTGLRGSVNDYTFAQLQEIDLGAGQHFCSLSEALQRFPATRFNIDIKSADAVAPAAEAIVAARAEARVLVTSFSERRRRATILLIPEVATSSGAVRFAAALVAGKLGCTPLLRFLLRNIDAVQVPQRASGMTITTRRMITRLHSAAVEVHIWTINDAPTMNALLDLGVDGLVTDRADIALDVIRSRK